MRADQQVAVVGSGKTFAGSFERQVESGPVDQAALLARLAKSDKPAGLHWLGDQFRETGVTLNQIRMDRQLEEALTRGPDALHLVAVFGISERAAMRYANAAKAFLESILEQNQ
ncbi:hypothetical protein [Streptomyces sp. NBC_01591]|uniref:hypothetical protein n=1 Tax=Streptomyces sp. NBC_01591 TaxID=2975888 RepID=UPI003FA3B170